LIQKLSAFLRSPALRAAAMLMAGGFGFAIANVLLARVLLSSEFGTLSLFLALIQLGLTLGPLGLDLAIIRHRLDATAELKRWALSTSFATGLLVTIAAWLLYGIAAAMLACILVAAVASSFNRFGISVLQVQQRFGLSLLLGQVHNYVLLLGVPLLWLIDRADALPVMIMIGVSYVTTCVIGWRLAAATPLGSGQAPLRSLVRESVAGFGIAVATQALWQLERLVIPRTLSLEDLATFAVVAALAGSPFRMLQIGIGHTLLPGLRACRCREDVTRLIRREGGIVCAASAAAVVVVLALTPWIVQEFLMGRYDISLALLLAVILTGLVKVCNGLVSAIVQAFGSTAALAVFNLMSFLGLVVGVACAAYAARFGVVGVVYGVGVAWLAMTLAAALLAVLALRTWSPTPEEAPVASTA